MAEWHEVVCEGDCEYIAVTDPGGLALDGAVCVLEIGSADAAPEDPEAFLIPLRDDAMLCLAEALLALLCSQHWNEVAPQLAQLRRSKRLQ
jgi:hypothetical protein